MAHIVHTTVPAAGAGGDGFTRAELDAIYALKGEVLTPEQIDATYASKDEVPTPAQLNATYALKSEIPTTAELNATYALKEEVPTATELDATYALKDEVPTTAELNATYALKEDVPTTAELDAAYALKAEVPSTATLNATYSLKNEVPTTVGRALFSGGMLYMAGRYYSPGQQSSAQSQAAAANRLYLSPFWGNGRTFDRIGMNVLIAGTAGNVARLGIYAADATGWPAALLVDSGSAAFPVDTVTGRETPISITIPGLVWLAFTAQSGTFTSWSSTSTPSIIGATSLTAPNPVNYMYPTTSYAATSALPATLAGATYTFATGNVPSPLLRAA